MTYALLEQLRTRRSNLLAEQSQRQQFNITARDGRVLAQIPRRLARLDNEIADVEFALDEEENGRRDIRDWH